MADVETTNQTKTEEVKAPKSKPGKIKKKRDQSMHPPRRKRRVVSAKAKGSKIEVEFNGSKVGEQGPTEGFACSCDEHATTLAAHVGRLHARSKLSGIRYSIRKLANDFELLRKAQDRSVKVAATRKKKAEEKRRERELAEAKKAHMEARISSF
jgi:hypothetical protein